MMRPRHLAIIMDGNGRWARSQGWERIRGHERGAEAVRTVTTACARLGIPWLTLYAFSSENWSRPAHEVAFLMRLLGDFLDREAPTLHANRIRLEAIGQLHRLPDAVRGKLEALRSATAGYDGTTLTLALSYGGRDELVDACRALAARVAAGELRPDAIDATVLGQALYQPASGDVDLIIRTAGEQRLSNFLPWQASYAEYIASPVMWPDFGEPELMACLDEFARRERRFGGV